MEARSGNLQAALLRGITTVVMQVGRRSRCSVPSMRDLFWVLASIRQAHSFRGRVDTVISG
jgi:hypothetical protein